MRGSVMSSSSVAVLRSIGYETAAPSASSSAASAFVFASSSGAASSCVRLAPPEMLRARSAQRPHRSPYFAPRKSQARKRPQESRLRAAELSACLAFPSDVPPRKIDTARICRYNILAQMAHSRQCRFNKMVMIDEKNKNFCTSPCASSGAELYDAPGAGCRGKRARGHGRRFGGPCRRRGGRAGPSGGYRHAGGHRLGRPQLHGRGQGGASY